MAMRATLTSGLNTKTQVIAAAYFPIPLAALLLYIQMKLTQTASKARHGNVPT